MDQSLCQTVRKKGRRRSACGRSRQFPPSDPPRNESHCPRLRRRNPEYPRYSVPRRGSNNC